MVESQRINIKFLPLSASEMALVKSFHSVDLSQVSTNEVKCVDNAYESVLF